jgi:L-ascorbate metabolism protein UlaG (beta-lactamase superfamily)
MPRSYRRREFLALAASGAAAAAFAAACGSDDEDDSGQPDAARPSGPQTAAAGPSPGGNISPGADNAVIGLRWFGQSMFLLTSPGGTTLLLDPFNDIGYTMPAPLGADVVTITHEHPDHNNETLGGGGARVLRGLTADGWASIDETAGDLRIRTVQTYHDDRQGAERGRNAVFVVETAGLRIAHFGDLGHQLSGAQLAALGGPVDVAVLPVGGRFTIDAAAATAVMQQLAPKAVFPSHYKTPQIAFPLDPVDPFLEGKTVQRVGDTTIRFSRADLPGTATVYVLDYE